MTNPAKITAFLTTHKGQSYCDDCLAKKLRLARRQEAQQITATLATTHGSTRVTGSFSICSKVKLIICAT